MDRHSLPPLVTLLALLFCLLPAYAHKYVEASGTPDGMEEWGYVQVRPRAYMFWWLYRSPNRVDNGSSPWPTVLWLQGGPGASGVGYGNFLEIGPLDKDLKPRNSTWLKMADLLFVDSPVGTGYSYVEDQNLLVKTDEEAATDLTTLVKELYNKSESLRMSPLYIASESYGGKYAVMLGLSLINTVRTGELDLKLGGITIGDGWISPVDYVMSWGPLLRDVARLDSNGEDAANRLAEEIKQQIDAGQFGDATNSMYALQAMVDDSSTDVDVYNFLLDGKTDPNIAAEPAVAVLMNGIIRQKLMIIPDSVRWDTGSRPGNISKAMQNNIMKPKVNEVDELLFRGVNITIYNGQFVFFTVTARYNLCDKRNRSVVQKLKWEGLDDFLHSVRKPLYCKDEVETKGYYKSYQNLGFYWILNAGHMVPVDQPYLALKMIREITDQSPAAGPI